MTSAALLYGHDTHYIDHIAPLAAVLNIPLVVTCEKVLHLIKIYYPDVNVHLEDPESASRYIYQHFDLLYTNLPAPFIRKLFFVEETMGKKRLPSILLPHGLSDKEVFEGYKEEKNVLVYGNKMIQALDRFNLLSSLHSTLSVGNYRYLYYKKNKERLDSLIGTLLPSKKPRLLFAPSWEDKEETLQLLAQLEPTHYELIVKLHPNSQTLSLKKANTTVLKDFPPIYPLLNAVDALIVTTSSVGYDALFFPIPLYSFNDPKGLKSVVTTIRSPFDPFEEKKLYEDKRIDLLLDSFDLIKSLDSLKDHLEKGEAVIRRQMDLFLD